MAYKSPLQLKALLQRVLAEQPGETDVTELARTAFMFASTRLRQLMGQGRLHLQSFHIPLEGIAFDCIAELFERSEDGVFVELRDSFSGSRDLALLEESEVLHYFRSIVFTSVGDGIFRMYREHDPILAKILRNLKIAVRKSPRLCSIARFGTAYVAASTIDRHNGPIVVLSLDDIEKELSRAVSPGLPMQEIEAVVEEITRLKAGEHPMCAILDLAVALKRIASRGEIPVGAVVSADASLLMEDIERIVRSAGAAALLELRAQYVGKQKVTVQLFEQYSHAISDILRDTFIRNDGSDTSQVAYLQRYVVGLGWEEYRSRHRAHFEYMIRKAKRLVQKELQELL
ncbi:MAG: hypothetical protein A3C56_02555 [Ignavibacteria bacterium RIFCSPHIGHO2_02_FULL_56_12]|nr:MAG: hypothetical protein A3C56_02555 [Ignavibacteria bacterium RIFCSPHIGHO2_02_FULL_56_12]